MQVGKFAMCNNVAHDLNAKMYDGDFFHHIEVRFSLKSEDEVRSGIVRQKIIEPAGVSNFARVTWC